MNSKEASIAKLESFLDRAVDPSLDEFDISAVDAFCQLIKAEPDLNANAAKILAGKIQSVNIKESLHTLDALEECMDTLGSNFHVEINKFKFLNELIRLVSKKFLGDKTPKEVQERILDILFTWTDKYPELTKIKEAYTMLRTQGILHEPQKNVIAPSKKSTDNTLKLMESEKFKRLLQSKNQKDIEAANLMIQNMVRDNDRRIQIQNGRLMNLQSANENSILLKEMLDEFDPSEVSEDTLSTLQEIYNNCVKLKPTVCRLAEESHESEAFMNKILETTDVLNTTIELYTAIIINKTPVTKKPTTPKGIENLLDVTGVEARKEMSANETLSELNDIFSANATTLPDTPVLSSAQNNGNILLTPHVVVPPTSTTNLSDIMAMINNHKPSVSKPQGDDLLGNFDVSIQTPTKSSLTSQNIPKTNEKTSKASLSEIDSIVSGMKSKLLTGTDGEDEETNILVSDDDNLISTIEVVVPSPQIEKEIVIPPVELQCERKTALKDINLDINDLMPSEIETPRVILDEKKGLKVIVNFTKDRPAKDVIVLVISVMNQGSDEINNFQFDASINKPCKIRIMEASETRLPGAKPFKAPTDTINQVLLLSNPTKQPINMIAILTYNIQDDDDPEKISIEVKNIPYES